MYEIRIYVFLQCDCCLCDRCSGSREEHSHGKPHPQTPLSNGFKWFRLGLGYQTDTTGNPCVSEPKNEMNDEMTY